MEGSSSNHVNPGGEPVYYWSRDRKTLWCSVPEIDGIRNVPTTKFHITAKLTGDAASVSTAEECFSLFFTPDMLNSIVQLTNEKIGDMQEGGPKKFQGMDLTDVVEMKAFLGILILSGIYLYEEVKELWDSNGYGADIFRATLSFTRFQLLLKCFTYAPDSVHHVSAFLQNFSTNCQDNFELGSYATMEQQMISYQGQQALDGITTLINNHHAICLLSVCDSKVKYTHACVLHHEDKDINDQVAKVTNKLISSDRLIVAEKSITTMSLVDYFSANDAFFLGQIKTTAGDIPEELAAKGKSKKPSIAYHCSTTLIRHMDIRSEEPVFLLCNLLGADTAVTDILETYDALTGQGNAVDAMCKSYSCAKRTNRWDVAVFFRLLDIACINAQIIFTIANKNCEGLSRRQYIKKLAGELSKPHIATRVSQTLLPFPIRQAAANVVSIPVGPRINIAGTVQDLPPPQGNSRRCQLCPKPNDCKSRFSCCSCNRCMCRKRAFLFCRDCINNPGPASK